MNHLLDTIPSSTLNRPPVCGAWVYRGDQVLDDPEQVDCDMCFAVMGRRERDQHEKDPWSWARMVAYTGEGSYGLFDWFAIGSMTFGVGIPIVWAAKPFFKAAVKAHDRRQERKMASTRLSDEQIESYCRLSSGVMVVLSEGPPFVFCGRNTLQEHQIEANPAKELDPDTFQQRYPDLPQVARHLLREEARVQ